jgi:hypothetical protein
MYLNCPRCLLSIRLRHEGLAVRHCPRCVARSRVVVSMFTSPLMMRELRADGGAPAEADGAGSDPRELQPGGSVDTT